jgi:hypothetical protein
MPAWHYDHHNPVASSLSISLGYEVTSQYMAKRL